VPAQTHVFHFSRRLNETDAKYFFLGRRSNCNLAMVMVAILPREFRLDELVEEFMRYETEIPRFADYLRRAPLDIAPPVWTPLPADMRRTEHYGREVTLPPGSGWRDVFGAVDAIQSTPFHPDRAPWQIAIVNGAPGGRSALVMKVHHVLSDGVALATLFGKAFAAEALAELGAPIEVTTDPPPRGSRLRIALGERAGATRRWLGEAVRDLPELGDRDRRRREGEAIRKVVRPRLRWPVTSYSRARHLAGFRVPMALWQQQAEARGGGPNELYLALVARIMRDLFETLEAGGGPLRLAMPIDLRGGRGLHDGGNTVGVGVVELSGAGAELADLTAVRERAAVAKRSGAEVAPTLFERALVDLAPGSLRAAVEFRRGAGCDALASSIPVPMQGKLLGVPVEMMFMIAPAIGQAVSFSLTAYADYLYLACNADLGIVSIPPDRAVEEVLAEVFGEHFESFTGGARTVP
jgi:diacylglycerol O-acyltransferase / wax synthase